MLKNSADDGIEINVQRCTVDFSKQHTKKIELKLAEDIRNGKVK